MSDIELRHAWGVLGGLNPLVALVIVFFGMFALPVIIIEALSKWMVKRTPKSEWRDCCYCQKPINPRHEVDLHNWQEGTVTYAHRKCWHNILWGVGWKKRFELWNK